jgi:hypothetical protein
VSKLPAFQLYTGDWLKDPSLSMCSPATRGIWIDLICAMHENDRSGEIIGTPQQLSRICRCSEEEMAAALAELEGTNAGHVTECPPNVLVRCRRMYRNSEVRKTERVKKSRQRSKSACPADVPQKSTSHTSVAVSVSPSGEEGADEESPAEIPAQDLAVSGIEQIAFQVYGAAPPATLSEWAATYPLDWIKAAMLATEQADKGRTGGTRYTKAILERYQREGGPKDGNQRAARIDGAGNGKPKPEKPEDFYDDDF